MAIIVTATTSATLTTADAFALPTGSGTALTSFRTFVIEPGGAATDTNWALAGSGPNGGTGNTTRIFGSTQITGYQTGTINAWSSFNQTGLPTTAVTYFINPETRTLMFNSTTAFWIAFTFSSFTGNQTVAFDDSGWTVGILNPLANGQQGLLFAWARGYNHTAGNPRTGQGGFRYQSTVNIQANNGMNLGAVRLQINSGVTLPAPTLNWFGCSWQGPDSTGSRPGNEIRTDNHFVFPNDTTGTVRNFEWDTTLENAAVPNFSFSVPQGVTLDGLGGTRSTFAAGAPATGVTNAYTPAVATRLVIGQNSNFIDRQQPLAGSIINDFTAVASGTYPSTFCTWRSSRLNLRTGNAAGRSLVPQIYNGWQYINANGDAIAGLTQARFYDGSVARTQFTGAAFPATNIAHAYEYGFPGNSNLYTYDICYQARYLVSPSQADGTLQPRTYVLATNGNQTDGSRTRFIPRYALDANGLMIQSRGLTNPPAELVTGLSQEFLASALYMYGKNDTGTTTVGNIPFCTAYTDVQTLSPATGNNVTFDATPNHLLIFDRWGSRLSFRTQSCGANQLTTAFTLVLADDPYIKAADVSTDANRAAALARLSTSITLGRPVQPGPVTSVTINQSIDLNQLYESLEASVRPGANTGANTGLNDLGQWQDPSTTSGILTFNQRSGVTPSFDISAGGVTRWTPTTGKTAITGVNTPFGQISIFPGVMPLISNVSLAAGQINANSQTITVDLAVVQNITNMVTLGQIVTNANVNFGTSSAITMTGNMTIDISTRGSLTGSLALTPNASGRTLVVTGLTAANITGFNLSNTTPGTQIVLVGWPNGVTVPNGFTAQSVMTITVNYPNNVSLSNLRVEKIYRNAVNTAETVGAVGSGANWIRTINGSVVTYSGVVSPTDTISIVGFTDGYQRFAGRSASAGATSFTIIVFAEPNIGFESTVFFNAADLAFISGSVIQVLLNGSTQYAGVLCASNVTYTTGQLGGSALTETGKLVMRKIEEKLDSTTNTYHFALARGTIAVDHFIYNTLGIAMKANTNLQFTKSAINTATVITVGLYCIDSLGAFYNMNTANGLIAPNTGSLVLFQGFNPGALANLTVGQIGAITVGVQSGLVGTVATPGPLSLVARGVESASLLVPATIAIPPAN